MRIQLPLSLVHGLSYSSESFVTHSGVRSIVEAVATLAAEYRSAVIWIDGEASSGKTHLAAYCAGVAQAVGGHARVISGDKLAKWHAEEFPGLRPGLGEAFIVDDADLWLSQPGCEGVLTSLADRAYESRGLLVLLSRRPFEQLALAPQPLSRLRAGVRLAIGAPTEVELEPILKVICRQRGLSLTKAKREFVLKRVSRSLPALTSFGDRLLELSSSTNASSTSFEVLEQAMNLYQTI